MSAGLASDLLAGPSALAAPPTGSDTVAFHGAKQAGIATAQQQHLFFASFDVEVSERSALESLLMRWTRAARRMCAGDAIGTVGGPRSDAPVDTGEAYGLPASRLTLTFGFGPTLFERNEVNRFGLASRRPDRLRQLPPLPGDRLEHQVCGGDLCVQACADDSQVAFHAIRNLGRIADGMATMRWSQVGFGRASTTAKGQETPRNLMGFKDGTNNIKAQSRDLMRRHVWTDHDARPSWFAGGSFLVARKIRMHLGEWDTSDLREQQRTIGRKKVSGAPLGKQQEFDPVPLDAHKADGTPVIPMDAHIRMAGPDSNHGNMLLRRGYSYYDGVDEDGELDAGLFFIAFVRDPIDQFAKIQRKLGKHDALSEYVFHTSSAVFACPPGIQPGDWIGRSLLHGT